VFFNQISQRIVAFEQAVSVKNSGDKEHQAGVHTQPPSLALRWTHIPFKKNLHQPVKKFLITSLNKEFMG